MWRRWRRVFRERVVLRQELEAATEKVQMALDEKDERVRRATEEVEKASWRLLQEHDAVMRAAAGGRPS